MPLGMAVGSRPTAGLEASHSGMPYTHEDSSASQNAVSLQQGKGWAVWDRGITDLLSAGAHRRLLLSRPPPRRTVRTLLEKQNWGVRHRGFAASPIPVS